VGLQVLLNESAGDQFDELLFWGKIIGLQRDYFIAMGVIYKERYEFPEKKFYYASSQDFVFKKFPKLEDQHKDKVHNFLSMFSGDPNKVLVQLEPEAKPEDEEAQQQQEEEQKVEFDPLASTEEEDESSKIVPVNLKEVDRLHFTVLAIENDCHIMPHGAMRLTEQHEVHRNVAFRGLDKNNAFVLSSYSHFRNV